MAWPVTSRADPLPFRAHNGLLAACGSTHASAASYNNHWGVPLTLARMPASSGFGVFEIGMNHAGEIAPLARMARPHVALVTTIAAVHLGAVPSNSGTSVSGPMTHQKKP